MMREFETMKSLVDKKMYYSEMMEKIVKKDGGAHEAVGPLPEGEEQAVARLRQNVGVLHEGQ